MAVAFDAVGAGNTAVASGSVTESHVATGSNLAVVAFLTNGELSGSFTGFTRSVTYGGVAMTSLGAIDNGGNPGSAGYAGFIEAFGLLNAPAGTNSVVASASPSGDLILNSVSYTGVGSFGTPALSAQDFVVAAPPSLVVSSATGHMVACGFSSGAPISGPTQTQRYLENLNNNSGAGNALIQDAAGASSVTFSAAENDDYWGMIGIDLIPSGGAPPATGQFFAMF